MLWVIKRRSDTFGLKFRVRFRQLKRRCLHVGGAAQSAMFNFQQSLQRRMQEATRGKPLYSIEVYGSSHFIMQFDFCLLPRVFQLVIGNMRRHAQRRRGSLWPNLSSALAEMRTNGLGQPHPSIKANGRTARHHGNMDLPG
jgi:hypothetical protein